MNEEILRIEVKNAVKKAFAAKNAAQFGGERMSETDLNGVKRNISRLQDEIKRISNTTLRGNFSKPEDKEYWVTRLKELNSKLSALEELEKKNHR